MIIYNCKMSSSTMFYCSLAFLFLAFSIPNTTSTKVQSPKGLSSVPDYYLYVDEDTILPKVNSLDEDDISIEPDLEIHPRWKRDSGDYQASWKVVGAGLSRTIKKLVTEPRRISLNVKLAIEHGNFSNVTERDIGDLDPVVLEYLPPNMFPSMTPAVKNKVVDIFLATNRANALSRFLEATAQQVDPQQLLPKINLAHGRHGEEAPNEAASILLYHAASRSLGNYTNDQAYISKLRGQGLLKYVPEELFMKIKSDDAARTLLTTLYEEPLDAENNNIDDKSLIYRLIEVGHGLPENITLNKFENLLPKFYAALPAAFLKKLNPEIIMNKLSQFKNIAFGTTLQRKAVADSYLAAKGIETNNIEGATSLTKQQTGQRSTNFESIVDDLGPFAAFVNPSIATNDRVSRKIVEGCSNLNLPAPVTTVHHLIKLRLKGGRQLSSLNQYDFRERDMKDLLIHSPPNVIRQAIAHNAFNKNDLDNLSHKVENSASNSYLKGLISQLGNALMNVIKDDIPPAFLGALGVNDIQRRDRNAWKEILAKLNKSQDSLDEVQKGILIIKLQSSGVLDLEQEASSIPPAIAALLPRNKNQKKILPGIINGLPSESDLRLAFGEQHKNIRPQDLLNEPLLVGTLTPSQVKSFQLNDIPTVLAIIRKSSDGPSSHTLKVLSERFAEYIRNKTDDTESSNAKLLQYISAAEVSRLPATVLAYFMDQREIRKLPDAVKREIMIALGTLSTKDHALIPSKTREEMILNGLNSLDKTLERPNVYDVPEVAMLAHGVVDLPPDRIRKLSPVALELALDVVQGNVDDDDDGLRQRACLKPEQRQAWRNKIIETYGSPNTWTPGTVTSLCCSLGILEEGDLQKITKESLVTCKCISDERPPSHLKNLRQALNGACAYELGHPDSSLYALNKIRAQVALDIEDLEEQVIQSGAPHSHGRNGRRRRRNRRDGGYSVQGQEGNEDENEDGNPKRLSCTALRLVGSASEYEINTVNTFWEKEIHDCLYELGVDPLSIDVARILWTKLVNMHGKDIREIQPHTLRKAGYILRGITKSEVDQVDFSNDDKVAPFGVNLGLQKFLLEHMASHLEKSKHKQWEQFDGHDVIVAGNIICGADIERLTRLHVIAFKQALPHLKNLHQDCELNRLAVLANLATSASVFGDPTTWTAADVRGLGIIFKGLTSKDIAKIQPEAFLGLSPSVAANLMPETLHALTPEQVNNIPRFSALAMRQEQINALSPPAREKLETNKKGSLVSGTTINKVQMDTIWSLLTLVLTAFFAQRIL